MGKDKSSASEAKPVEVAEIKEKNTDPSVTPAPATKPKCSEPEIIRNSSSDGVEQQTAQPKQVENPPEPPQVEPSQASSESEAKSCQPAPVRTAARRVPPGGHCSQLW